LFTISVLTAICYGTFTPQTSYGQLIVIVLSMPVIYLTIVLGKKNIYFFKNKLCKGKNKSVGQPAFFSIMILLSFKLIGGSVLSWSEGWCLLESIYFCWVSFTTIGFGDYAPVVGNKSRDCWLAIGSFCDQSH